MSQKMPAEPVAPAKGGPELGPHPPATQILPREPAGASASASAFAARPALETSSAAHVSTESAPEQRASSASGTSGADAVAAAAVAGAHSRMQAREANLCKCRGHCGAIACRKNESLVRRHGEALQICGSPPASGQDIFCHRCKCELCGAGRQQCHGDGRWCTRCFNKLELGRWRYVNQHGMWKMHAGWSEPLQCAARHAFVTNQLPPEDNAAWGQFLLGFDVRRLQREKVAPPGSEPRAALQHGDVVFVCLVAMAKWPSLLRRALKVLDAENLDPRLATAAEWRGLLLTFLDLCDGIPARDELKSITPGRTAACFGLIWLCKRLRLLAKVSPRSLFQPAGNQRRYKLGCLQNEYYLLPEAGAVAALQHLMDACRTAAIGFPPPFWHGPAGWQHGPAGSPALSQELPTQALELLAKDVHGLSLAICGSGNQLAAGTLSRRLLNIVEERFGITAWDGCQMSVLSEILPDICLNVPNAIQDRLAGDFRKRFGMSPLIVTAMACLWSSVPSPQRKGALKATHLQVLRAVEKCSNPHAQPKDWVPFLNLSA